MKSHRRTNSFVLAISIELACGPETTQPDRDPEETIAAFCENLFRCPDETEAPLNYDSNEDCEAVHMDDYENRDVTCRKRVLLLEQCLSELACEEFDTPPDERPCGDEYGHLTEECQGL
jgi:hypothetical protein